MDIKTAVEEIYRILRQGRKFIHFLDVEVFPTFVLKSLVREGCILAPAIKDEYRGVVLIPESKYQKIKDPAISNDVSGM